MPSIPTDAGGAIIMQDIPRREFITKGSAALAGLAAFFATRPAILIL